MTRMDYRLANRPPKCYYRFCGEPITEDDLCVWETVDGSKRPFHQHCYREGYQGQCSWCEEWFDKGILTLQSRECPDCYRAGIEEGIWNREPGDHNERSE